MLTYPAERQLMKNDHQIFPIDEICFFGLAADEHSSHPLSTNFNQCELHVTNCQSECSMISTYVHPQHYVSVDLKIKLPKRNDYPPATDDKKSIHFVQ